MPAKAVVSQADIVESLRQMGVREGDGVMVHSSLSSIGYVEGGAPTVVEAFLALLG